MVGSDGMALTASACEVIVYSRMGHRNFSVSFHNLSLRNVSLSRAALKSQGLIDILFPVLVYLKAISVVAWGSWTESNLEF